MKLGKLLPAILIFGSCRSPTLLDAFTLELSTTELTIGDVVRARPCVRGECGGLAAELIKSLDDDLLTQESTGEWVEFEAVAVGEAKVALIDPLTGLPVTTRTISVGCRPTAWDENPDSAPVVEHTGVVSGVWKPEDGTHVISGNVQIVDELTIEACTTIRAEEGATLSNVTGEGRLTVRGSRSSPIVIGAVNSSTRWNGLELVEAEEPHLLRGLWLRDTVGVPIGDGRRANIFLQGHDIVLRQVPVMDLKDITIDGCADVGIALARVGVFAPTENALATFVDCAIPFLSDANSISVIPSSSFDATAQYVETGGGWLGPGRYTWRLRDLPILVRGDLIHGGVLEEPFLRQSARMWGIEPGVELRFEPGVQVSIGGWGPSVEASDDDLFRVVSVNWEGTPQRPILLTSASSNKAPGQWCGIVYETAEWTHRSRTHFVIVEYAGGGCNNSPPDGTNPGAIRVPGAINVERGGTQFSGSTLRDNLGYAIATTEALDITAYETEVFDNVPACFCNNELGAAFQCEGEKCNIDCTECVASPGGWAW